MAKLTVISLFVTFGTLSLTLVASSEIDRCANVSVSDEQVSKWLKIHAPTQYWERPTIDSKRPINIYIKMGITSFAKIVNQSFVHLTCAINFMIRMRRLNYWMREAS